MTREEQINEVATMYESVARYGFRGTAEAFKAGARWADAHPQSPWIPIGDEHPLPEPGKLVLLYYPIKDGRVELSERIISKSKRNKDEHYNGHDEYGFEVGTEVVNPAIYSTRKVCATYWMPIPDPNEKGGSE